MSRTGTAGPGRAWAQRALDGALRRLYPPDLRCAACRRERDRLTDHLCPECVPLFRLYEGESCPLCGRPTDVYGRCRACRAQPPPMVRGRTAYVYRGAPRRLLHRFKFDGQSYLADFLAERLLLCLAPYPSLDCVTAVPSHGLRVMNRGYSTAGLLARSFSRLTGLPEARRALVRRHDSRPRYLRQDWSREAALRDYALRDAQAIRGKRVLLLDDILTSGNTLAACAQRLQEGGAAAVFTAVVAAAHEGGEALETAGAEGDRP